jgi:hypothetical protein
MVLVESSVPVVDVRYEVMGTIGRSRFHVLVTSRNGVVHSVSFQDERLNKYLTEEEQKEIEEDMKKRYTDKSKQS